MVDFSAGSDAAAVSNDSFTKMSMDVKFGAGEFFVKVQNKINGKWLDAGNSKEVIDRYGRLQADPMFYYDADRWYNLTYVIDTVYNEGRFYLDGEYICTNNLAIPAGSSENPTQVQFCIGHKTATASASKQLWVDNLKVETSPYCFKGMTGGEYETAAKDTKTLTMSLNANPGSGIAANALFTNGTSAGTVNVDAATGNVSLSTETSFDEKRDITLSISDASSGEIIAKKTFTFINGNGAAIGDIEITELDNAVNAVAYVKGGNGNTKLLLLLVRYNNAEKTRMTGIDVIELTPTSERTAFTATLPKDLNGYYTAYAWDSGNLSSLKESADLAVTQVQ